MTEQNFPTRNELEAKVIAQAWQDEEFKQELLSHPRATIIREWGLKDLPDNIDIKVIEENSNTLYMVLPMKPVTTNGEELSEEQLEAIAGGFCWDKVVQTVREGVRGCLGL
jgi:hypothetical protein